MTDEPDPVSDLARKAAAKARHEMEAMEQFTAGEIPSWELLAVLKANHPGVRCWADAVVMLAENGFWPPSSWKMHPAEQAQVDNFVKLLERRRDGGTDD